MAKWTPHIVCAYDVRLYMLWLVGWLKESVASYIHYDMEFKGAKP